MNNHGNKIAKETLEKQEQNTEKTKPKQNYTQYYTTLPEGASSCRNSSAEEGGRRLWRRT